MRRKVPRRSPIGRLMRKGHDSSHPLKKKKRDIGGGDGRAVAGAYESKPTQSRREKSIPVDGFFPFLFPRFACACGGRWDAVADEEDGGGPFTHTHGTDEVRGRGSKGQTRGSRMGNIVAAAAASI